MPSPTENRAAVQAVPEALTFTYTNYRGEVAERRIDPSTAVIRFEATEWHPEPQWIIEAWDEDKNALRGFALKDCVFGDLHARLSQSTEAVQPNYNPAGSDYTEAGSEFNADALAQEIRRVDGNHSLGAGALAEALMPFLSRVATEVGPSAMTGADVLRIFRPLPDDEVSALREVMPELYGDAEAGPDEGRAGDDIPTDEQLENRLLCWARKADRDSEWDHVSSDLRLAAKRISRTSSDGERCASGDRFKLANRMRGMFDMSKKSADAFNHLSPAGFRLLQQIHDTLSAATAQEAEETGGWLTIDSAPKDGSQFLATSTLWHGDCIVVGWHFGAWREDARPEAQDIDPTHWMPLPASPTDREGER